MEKAMQRHELTAGPVSCRDLLLQFQPVPSDSLKELLIKMGPFEPETDAFRFNNSFGFTDVQVEQIRQRYLDVTDFVLSAGPLRLVRDFLNRLSVDIPLVGRVGLPDFIIDGVIGIVQTELIRLLIGLINDVKTLSFGRCGGMAFSGYDFYLLDWTVDERLGTTPPDTGVLGDYIFSRLLDSLELNAGRFLEWFTILHLLPDAANVALGTVVGSWAGPIGEAFGVWLGPRVHVFDPIGRRALLGYSVDEWPKIKSTLDGQAAWPIGCVFADSDFPTDDHQILAVDYRDNGDGTAALMVWDNNDGAFQRELELDFTGDELQVFGFKDNRPLKGIFLEEYSPHQPPDSLRLS